MNPVTPRTQALRELDKRHVWHPFTQMKDWLASDPVVIDRAEGHTLYDTDGNAYLDGVSSLWANLLGHRVPEIDRAIVEQLGKVAHCTYLGLAHEPGARLAEKLVDITPAGLTKVFYSDSGATAMEIALKMAYQYWYHRGEPKRTTFLALEEAYHGDTIGSVSLGGMELFHTLFKPLLFPVLRVPTPYAYRSPYGEKAAEHTLEQAEAILREKADTIAAFVLEPLMQGAAGMLSQPAGFVKKIRELCDRYNVLLVADEVAVGFGRTGTLFACEQEGVSPDIMALAKGLTGGYLPLAATLTTEEIFNAFLGEYEEFKTFFHGHTYTANPLGCAAALATLEYLETHDVMSNVRARIEQLAQGLVKSVEPLAIVGDIRRWGLMTGIELVRDRATKEPFPATLQAGAKVCLLARKHGVMIRPLGNVIVLMSPLTLRAEEMGLLLDAVTASIKEFATEQGVA